MPGSRDCPCILCRKRTKPQERRKVNKDIGIFLQKTFFTNSKEEDVICNKCRHKYYLQRANPTPQTENNSDQNEEYHPPQKRPRANPMSSPPSISLQIPSTSKSHAYCFVCKKPGPKLIVVPAEARFSLFMDQAILVPAGSRCCPGHLGTTGSSFVLEAVNNLKTTEYALVNRKTIVDLLKRTRDFARKNCNTRIDFDKVDNLSNDDCLNLTGLSKQNFINLCDSVKPSLRNSPVRSMQTTVGIFLMKLRSGMSNNLLATIFNISKSSLRRAVCSVRQALMSSFVPSNLGLKHVTREEVIQKHTRPLAQTLFGDVGGQQVILVLDGTYIYIQKSNNFHFQRRTYSLHKGRPLVKPMVVVSTSGYFVTIVGPYLADSKNNDAAILNHMLKTNVEDIREWVQEDDIFIVDRGFRDSLSLLEDLGIKADMPRFLSKGDKQMSTSDANTSRLVTKVRWVVESANARIKTWKYLAHVLPTNQVPYIGDYVRIVCALSNKYCPPLSSTDNADQDECLGAKMLYLAKQVNSLKAYVEEKELHRKSKAIWKPMEDDNLSDFPLLDEEQLRNITCGTYQLKLSSSYIQEHVDGNCDIHTHQEEEGLIRVRIQSRHTSSKTYLLWIRYNSSQVEAWYCKCRAGARVVGVCAHVASIIWYFGYAKHMEPSKSVGVRNWGSYLEDASKMPEIVDGSDSDSDTSVIEE